MSEKSRQDGSSLDSDLVYAALLFETLLDIGPPASSAAAEAPALSEADQDATPGLAEASPPPGAAAWIENAALELAPPLPLAAATPPAVTSFAAESPGVAAAAGPAVASSPASSGGLLASVDAFPVPSPMGTGSSIATTTNAAPAPPATSPTASPAFKFQGVNYVADIYGSFDGAGTLSKLAADNINAVAITADFGIDAVHAAVYDNDVQGGYTESASNISKTISQAAGLGLQVMYRPLIDFLPGVNDTANPLNGSYYDDEWRSYYNPGVAGSAGANAFFASYQSMIVAQAKLAQAAGATMFSIGLELDQLTGPSYKSDWDSIITAVRSVFSGKLTYGADWDDSDSPWQYGGTGLPAGTGNVLTQVSFWSELDYIGIDEYAPISNLANPTVAQLIQGWTASPTDDATLSITGDQSLMSYYEGLAAAAGKPMLFTEIGYANSSDAASDPASPGYDINGNPDGATADPTLSANLYTAFIDAWRDYGNGSLAGAYVWNWEPSGAGQSPFNPEGLAAETALKTGFGSARVTHRASADFNGDGISDILWRNTDTGADSIWDLTPSGGRTAVNPGTVVLNYQVVGVADFNGDGIADILWRDTTNGANSIWDMNASGGHTAVNPGTVASSYVVAGVGDFNGDGTADILWRDPFTGADSIWDMTASGGRTAVNPGTVATSWVVAGVGDFNDDGVADILWRNVSTGADSIWDMNASGGHTTVNPGTVATAYEVAGVGDFNGDGVADILWRNTSTGADSIWDMTAAGGRTAVNPGTLATNWQVAAIGDFNGDGVADILWRDTTTGADMIWDMNASGGHTTVNPGTVVTSWKVAS